MSTVVVTYLVRVLGGSWLSILWLVGYRASVATEAIMFDVICVAAWTVLNINDVVVGDVPDRCKNSWLAGPSRVDVGRGR